MWKDETLYAARNGGAIVPVVARLGRDRLVMISMVLVALTVILGATRYFTTDNKAIVDTAIWTCAFLGTAILYNRGKLRLAGHAVVLFALIGVTSGALWLGGIDSAPLYWASFIPLCAIILIGVRAGAIYTALTLLALVVISFYDEFVPVLVAHIAAPTIFSFSMGYFLESSRSENQHRLARFTLMNQLSQLPGRVLFDEHLQRLASSNRAFVLTVVDVDGLKRINDQIGQPAGDALLRTLAERLTAITAPSEQVFHLMADLFAILSEETADVAEVTRRLKAVEDDPIDYLHATFALRVSIGGVTASGGQDSEALLAIAESNMVAEKSRRRQKLQRAAS